MVCIRSAARLVFDRLALISLGYAHNASPLAGYAPIIGVYGIGALCLLMAIALIRILRDRCYPYLVLLLAIPACGWLLQQLEWSEPLDNSLKVTIVQGNIPQELKWQFDQRQNIFNTYWRETSNNWDSDLIVWPRNRLARAIGKSRSAGTRTARQCGDSAG